MSKYVKSLGQITCVIGAQWGDEGKGKLVDILSSEYDIIARYAGGANAGHTIHYKDENGEDKKVIFHLMPSGMLHDDNICVIGNGTVIHFPTLLDEMHELKNLGFDFKNRLFISDRAHMIFDYHLLSDSLQDGNGMTKKIGTTRRGIGPAYADKIARTGARAHLLRDPDRLVHIMRENCERLQKIYNFEFNIDKEINKYADLAGLLEPCVCDTSQFLDEQLKDGKSLLIEGAQGMMLDIDHGTYPYVTSSNTTVGGAMTGLGIAPQKINSVVGIIKAYTTRVGEGPMPTKLGQMEEEMLRDKGGEFGATTGRPRHCGWFDSVVAKYAARLNGFTSMNLTKLDILTGLKEIKIGYKYSIDGEEITSMPADADEFEKIEVEYVTMPGWDKDISKAKKFSDLPKNAQAYVKKIEELIEVPIQFIGVGVYRDEMIEVSL